MKKNAKPVDVTVLRNGEAEAAAVADQEAARWAGDRIQKPPTGGQAIFSNFEEIEIESETNGSTKTKLVHIGLPIDVIKTNLHKLTDGFPKRVGSLLFTVRRMVFLRDPTETCRLRPGSGYL